MNRRWFTYFVLAGLVVEVLSFSVFAEETDVEKVSDKGKIVARVNGVPLYEKDVYSGLAPPLDVEQLMECYKIRKEDVERYEKEDQPRRERLKEDMLSEGIKKELFYQEAKRFGLDKRSGWSEPAMRRAKMGRPSFFIDHGMYINIKTNSPNQDHEWAVLVNFLMQKLGLDDFKKIQISQEEIEQYYEKNPGEEGKYIGEFFRMSRDMYAKMKIYTQKVKEYVDSLWKSAKIEIIESIKTEEIKPFSEE